jgi:uncharacterized membrane protein required for colicin V production
MSVSPAAIDLIITALILLMTYALMSEGVWGAAVMFFNVLFSGLITFNFYEPLAELIDSTGIGWGFSDTFSMLFIFCISVVLLRMTTESLAPAMLRFPMPIDHVGRFLFGLGTSLLTVAILLLSCHTAPVHKKIFGTIDYNRKPPFGLGLDHKWLGFFQYTTGGIFARYGSGAFDPFSEYGRSGRERVPVRIFDPRATWLLTHQEARPYGEGPILEDEGEGAGTAVAAREGRGADVATATSGGSRDGRDRERPR